MICYDAFYLSHTYEPVDIPDQAEVDEWLPAFEPEYFLEPGNPQAFNGLVMPDVYMEMRFKLNQAHENAKQVVNDVGKSFSEQFGRTYGATEPVQCDDADIILVVSSSATSPARLVVEKLRNNGKKVGLLKVRMFRPFPTEEIRKTLEGAKKVAVIDRNFSWGKSGIFADEIRGVMVNQPDAPLIYGYICGLGGRSITPDLIEEIIEEVDASKFPNTLATWKGLKS